jgi:hypothetical protein
MTDTEMSQLRQNLMAQFQQMQMDELPANPQDQYGDTQSQEWSQQR